MEALIQSLVQLFWAVFDLLVTLGVVLLPFLPLAAWVIFWLCAVNWVKLAKVMLSGGLIAVVMIGLVASLVWGMIAPPPGGTHLLLGLSLSNFVGKIVYVAGLICIMFLCGSVQLSGVCGSYCRFDDQPSDVGAHESTRH